MRRLVAPLLFAAACGLALNPDVSSQEPKKQPEKKAQPKKVDPKEYIPDAPTLQQIKDKTEQLRKAVEALKEKKIPDDVFVEVAIYLKAAENIVRFEEWLHKDSVKWTQQTLDQGLERAKQAEGGRPVWRDAPGKWVLRAYRSHIDDSIQPYAVLLPHDYGKDPAKKWRLDIVLHGRDGALTESKFIATHNGAAPKDRDFVQLEVYGRGNNAYRWAGESDVFEAVTSFRYKARPFLEGRAEEPLDPRRTVLRGFSMGGAGTWHIGLHHPGDFCVIGPGAGFTTTHGYVGGLPDKLADHQEKCLRIYDAVDYVENAFDVPIVAYSGEIDAQKKAADNIEELLKKFKEPVRFTHLVAPNLPHTMPPEWQAKAETEYRKFADKGRERSPERVRFVTYTPKYDRCDWVQVDALGTTYERALLDGTRKANTFTITTTNVRRLHLWLDGQTDPVKITIDGQVLDTADVRPDFTVVLYAEKVGGKWVLITDRRALDSRFKEKPEKRARLQGPIDDAFVSQFIVIKPAGAGFHDGTDKFASASADQFAGVWDRYFRGALPVRPVSAVNTGSVVPQNVVLFGDPQSNPLIAHILPKLPITWTKDKLVVNGVEYDPKTHVPVLIYPNPIDPRRYVVLNSGHTFKEADLKGTNALLYPRLGDWAVIKPTPTAKDPAAYEVVAAGLFDSNWQFAGPVAEGAKLEKLWGEGEFTEGPVEGPDGSICFSDIGDRIMRFDPKTGKTTEFRKPSGRSNGLKFDAKGLLVACEGANTGGGRRVSVTEKDGSVKTLADGFDGKRFNSPNDLTIDAKGRVYFSDPRYVGDQNRELDHESVYRIDPDGKVTRVVSDVTKPNGLVISPDGKTLYVAESNSDPKKQRKLLAYPLKDDGTVGARKELFDFGEGRGIDGMTVTADGVIVATAGRKDQAGVYFFSPEGKKLAVLATPEDPTNCCFAGADKKTLYVTAGKSLYHVKLTVTGK